VILRVDGMVPDAERLELDDDLYAAGLTSITAVAVVLAIEREFALELPMELLHRELFRTTRRLHDAIQSVATARQA
jgi:acyl carrier protein